LVSEGFARDPVFLDFLFIPIILKDMHPFKWISMTITFIGTLNTPLDTQNPASYTSTVKKQCLIDEKGRRSP